MSVMLETSLGELVIDLEVERCPRTCENFLKLCKIKYYALNAFFNVSKDFIAQAGDPTATGTGGESLASYLYSASPSSAPAPPRYFSPETSNKLKHTLKGTISMAVSPTDPPGCGSQFFVTLADGIEYLDGKHAVFGHVIEGLDTLDRINEAYLDREGRPLQDIRIRHVEILEDPFPDPHDLISIPPSPVRPPDVSSSTVVRISDNEDPLAELAEEEAETQRRRTAAASSALTLEMIGDIPFATVRPPENILFVCKLNPVTQDEDLELIFSRFGKILSCEVVRDRMSGDSLQYAFIEFDERESAEKAYFKMQNVLVDDRRIWVDFSQSVAKTNVSTLTSHSRGRGRGRGAVGRGGGGGRGAMAASGYGGREGLEASRRYRDDEGRVGAGGYGMVFDDGAGGRKRSRSPRRDRERDRGERREKERNRDRSRSRSREKYRDVPRDRERDRDRRHRDEGDAERRYDRERDRRR
ncbi:MAG: Peptidyl-prolyl cis-trans isomerase cyp6 [Tremellales sp. Tagirdzhanova-0007]|nr:MAG: Peptidyl-prolyl cis-trans isomerase cyp6 [Tremellales sp. Tagirdzhanova-0007]